MQTILLAVDFSPASRNAAVFAAELAKLLHTKLLLFHAYMLPTPISEVPYAMVTVDNLQKENEEQIKKEADWLHDDFGLEIEWLVRIGIASDEIKTLTREKDIGLIVMGMKGAGGLDKIIGSTTINVSRKVKTPVLVVPHDAAYTPIKNITYASDFSYKTSTRLFNPLLELARAFAAKTHILFVRQHHGGNSELEFTGKKSSELIFEGYDHEYVTTEEPSVNQGISRYLRQHSSELLVMVAHKHTFLERVFSKNHTTAMAYETHVPLLILQDKD
ncbi:MULTISPECIES: universal stress protein [Niastella]|uniref:Universal stress protein n=1 Tax=Niastella soli TaxID=2821487 RepID=A0ABS3YMG1_9BACT|nr:universal stress protein [Niastella soli]MBO9199056.1 universal stress protein [Niastella soli]